MMRPYLNLTIFMGALSFSQLSHSKNKVAFVDLNGLLANPIFRLDILEKFWNEYESDSEEIKSATKEWAQTMKTKREKLGDAVLNKNIQELVEETIQENHLSASERNKCIDNYIQEKKSKDINFDESKYPKDTDTLRKIFRKQLKRLLQDNSEYKTIMCENIKLIEGAEELLISLRNQGYKIVLFTSQYQDIAEKQIKHLDIEKYFTKIIGNKDTNGTSMNKPNPELANKYLVQESSTEYLVLGDGIKDLLLSNDRGEARSGLAELARINYNSKRGVQSQKNKYGRYEAKRKNGISKDIATGIAIIINEAPSEELIQCLTPSEQAEFSKFPKTGGIGERIGWFPSLVTYNIYKLKQHIPITVTQ